MSTRRVWNPHPQWYFSLLLVAVFAWWIIEGQNWPVKTRLFPLVVAIPMLGLAIVQLARDIRGGQQRDDTALGLKGDGGQPSATVQNARQVPAPEEEIVAEVPSLSEASTTDLVKVTAELLAYFVGVYLLGFVEVIPVFATLYLRFEAKEPWWRAISIAVIVWAFIWGLFVQILHLPFPSGILTDAITKLF